MIEGNVLMVFSAIGLIVLVWQGVFKRRVIPGGSVPLAILVCVVLFCTGLALKREASQQPPPPVASAPELGG